MKALHNHMLLHLLGLAVAGMLGAKTTVIPYTPTTSIQSYVDAADAGDTLVLEEGTYTGDVTITKNLNIIRKVDAEVHQYGDFNINGTRHLPYKRHRL